MSVEIVEWRSFQRNTLQGFVTVKIPEWHLIINGIAVHEKVDQRWVQLPSKPMLDANRELVKEEGGKIRYSKILEFDDRQVATRFGDAILKALEIHIAKEAFAP